MTETGMPMERMNICVEVISRIDRESKEKGVSKEEFLKRGMALTKILKNVEAVWGKKEMLKVIFVTQKKIGHTPGPLDYTIVQDLLNAGCKMESVNKVLSYDK